MKTDIYQNETGTNFLTRLYLTALLGMLMSVLTQPAIAQTVLISPTGNGGFESGTSTFPANGWTVVNAANGNSWVVGATTFSAGTKSAYISSNGGGNNNYNKGNLFGNDSRTVHFYRDVAFPAGETSITLSFKWKGAGENGSDDLKVFLANTSVTPASGSEVAAGNLIGGPYSGQGSAYQTVNITISGANAGTSKRLIFSWRNNNNFLGSNPAGSFDEISLTTCAPPSITVSNSGPLCPGSNLDLSATGGGTYSWSGPGGFSSSSSNPTISNITSSNGGTYTVVVTSSGCSASATTSVAVLASPSGVAPTASASSVCSGTNFGLNANIGMPASQLNATDFAIPDNNTTGISSPITVSGAFQASLVASVTINITHPYVADLDIFLKAPNGSQIELSTDNGTSGDNYTNTVFVTGGTPITSGSAPFTGNFSPEQAFSNLTGSANGIWNLVVKDDAGADLGTLLDWTISVISSSGVTYSWSSLPSGFTGSGASETTSALVNTSYSVTATANGCSSTVGSAAVNILALPTVSTSSNSPVCVGTDVNLNASGGVSYSWSGPSYSSSQQNPTLSSVALGNAGNYTVIVTDAFGCTNSETIVVGVNENPSVSVTAQTNVTCNGWSDGGIEVTALGGTGPYLFSDGSNFNTDGLFSGLLSGPYTIEVIDVNSCMSTTTTTVTQPDPTTIAQAGIDQSACFGSSTTLAANTATVGTGSWSLVSGNAIFTNTLNPLSEISGMNIGPNVVRWTIDNGVCGSNYSDVTVTGLALPVAQVSGDPVICLGQNALLDVNFTGTAPWTYTYSDGTSTFGPFTTSNSSDLISVAPTTHTNYTLTTINDLTCAGSVSGTASVTVNVGLPTNTISSGAIVAPASACVGNVINVSCNNVGNINGYTWSVPAGTLINGEAGPYTTTSPNASLTLGNLPANSSGWQICVFASNACGSTNQYCFYVRGKVSMPSPIAGADVACENTTGSYSVAPVSGAQTYTWTGTGGVNVISGNGTTGVTVSFSPGFTQGTLCVAAGLTCGYNGPQRCFTIRNSTSNLGVLSGPFALCPGQNNQVFSVPSASGAANYQWTLPNNISLVSGQGTPSITVNVGNGFVVGNLCVTATSACGVISAPRCKTIASTSPPTPSNVIGTANGVCGQTISFSVPSINGVSGYNWTAPSGGTITSVNGNNSVDIEFANNFTTGQVCVTSQNACGSSAPRCTNVKGVPNTPGSISGANAVCANESGLSYSIAPIGGSNGYVWTVPAGASIVAGQNTSSIIVDWGSSNGTITVKASNDCGFSGTRTMNVTIGCRMSSSVSPEFSIFPNPASESATVSFETTHESSATIQLLDLSGRLVFEKSVSARKGNNQLTLDLKDLLKGTYLVKVNGIDNQSIGRLVIQ